MALDKLVYDNSTNLSDLDSYQSLQREIPAGMTPGVFIDMANLVTHLTTKEALNQEQTALFQQVNSLQTAVSIEDNVQKTFIILDMNE